MVLNLIQRPLLNTNAGAFSTLAALITAVATVVLAFLTAKYVKLTSELNKIHRPLVDLSLDYIIYPNSTYSIDVKIKNIGDIVARNITIEDDPLPSPFTSALEISDILESGIDILTPDNSIGIGSAGKIDPVDIPDKPVTIRIRYEDSNKQEYTNERTFDFSKNIRQFF